MITQNFWPDITVNGVDFYKCPWSARYGVSQCGRVCVLHGSRRGYVLNPNINAGGYYYLTLAPTKGRKKTAVIHRLVAFTFLGAVHTDIIDHIDRNRLNNRVENLRVATVAGNQRNRSKLTGRTSKYKGVYVHAPSGRFRARIRDGHRMRHLGYFDSEEAAGRAYDAAAKTAFGEFAALNFN